MKNILIKIYIISIRYCVYEEYNKCIILSTVYSTRIISVIHKIVRNVQQMYM